MEAIRERRAKTEERITALQAKLEKAADLIAGKACVYATGSFGRLEAGSHSDLDLFIVGRQNTDPDTQEKRDSKLRRLEEIRIKSYLIEVTQELGIPEFDGDGEYLTHHAIQHFTASLGTPEDDVTNTFTARLLLLLESRPLLEYCAYSDIISEVINAYWRDYNDHKSEFIPAYLANDILRLCRTFCVNYEARTQSDPPKKKAKRKVKNYKLKHSRLLTCYSALVYLLAIYNQHKTVSPQNAIDMANLTPTGRLEWLLEQQGLSDAHESTKKLLEHYEDFLVKTNCSESDLIDIFLDKEKGKEYTEGAYHFGDVMFELLNAVGNDSRFHRLTVV